MLYKRGVHYGLLGATLKEEKKEAILVDRLTVKEVVYGVLTLTTLA